jgi:hypothetical protein
MTMTPSGLFCPPRYGTSRNPDRETLGPQVGIIAAKLGMPLMPWQQYVADVAYELDETGQLAYSEVNLTVGRQQGKTALGMATKTFRCTKFGRQTVVYLAQSRNAARKKWEDEHCFILQHSPYKRHLDIRKSNGSEAIIWKNGSKWAIDAPTRSAGHGDTVDHGDLDEAFAHVDDRAEQALSGTMLTRPSSQLWVYSTAGDGQSYYWWRKILAGRAAIEEGTPGPVAFFEWSAPDDADPGDEDVWRAACPALGHTITIDKLRKEWSKAQREGVDAVDQFRRKVLNQWPEIPVLEDVANQWLIVGRDQWAECRDFEERPEGRLGFGLDVTPSGSHSSIGVSDGRTIELVDHRAGTQWVVDRVRDLVGRWGKDLVGFAVDPAGPAGAFLDQLEPILGERLIKITARQHAQAAGSLVMGIEHGSIRHRGESDLDSAVASATKRPLGDAFAFSRAGVAPISPLVAVTFARYAAANPPDVKPARTNLGIW